MADQGPGAFSGYRVAVLCGGVGSERAVSLVSGRSVAAAAQSLGLDTDLFELDQNRLPAGLDPQRHLVLPLVHGTYGEDGTLAAELASAGFAFGGCGQAASALCFDKAASKALANRLGLPVAPDRLLQPGHYPSFRDLAETVGMPFILKPRRDGSSVGLYLVREPESFHELEAAVGTRDYLAEGYREGHDLTVGVFDGEVLGIVAVRPQAELFDYESKYTPGKSAYEFPAKLHPATEDCLLHWSRLVYRAFDCRDLARVDFRIGRDGGLIFLEINTIPGMTPNSLFPKAARCAGWSFEDLVERWLWRVRDRAARRETG